MRLTPLKRFLYTAIPFAVLGAAFKVMVLVEGLTEIRPVNAIPIIAGLLCGPAGALGCAAGNLIADFFGTLSLASGMGMLGNFLAALLPWRLWCLFSDERPNVHTYRNLGLFALLSLISALTVAWMLGFGLEYFFDMWQQDIYMYVFLNNFAFSLGLGLPIFIVLTSDAVDLEPCDPPRESRFMRHTISKAITGIYLITLLVIFICILTGMTPSSPVMMIMSAAAVLLLLFITIISFAVKKKSSL